MHQPWYPLSLLSFIVWHNFNKNDYAVFKTLLFSDVTMLQKFKGYRPSKTIFRSYPILAVKKTMLCSCLVAAEAIIRMMSLCD